MKTINKSKPLKYKNHLLFRRENCNGYYVSVEHKNNVFIFSTSYKNDMESAVEAAKNEIDLNYNFK